MTAPRTTKGEYYLGIAREVARRSTCWRRSIGAIIVRDDQIISAGYVGAPRKTRDSVEHGFCLRDRLGIPHGQRYELCRSVHAEQNAIINAARAGVSLLGGDMYIFGTSVDGGSEGSAGWGAARAFPARAAVQEKRPRRNWPQPAGREAAGAVQWRRAG